MANKILLSLLLSVTIITSSTAINAKPASYDDCLNMMNELIDNNRSKSTDDQFFIWKNNYKDQCSHNGAYQMYIAEYYLEFRHYQKAKEYLLNELKHATYDTRIHKFFLGNAFLELGQTAKVHTVSLQLIKEYPQWYGGFMLLGQYYNTTGSYKLAEHCYHKTLLKDTDHELEASTYLALAINAYDTRDYHKVLHYYRKAVTSSALLAYLNISASSAAVVACTKLGAFSAAKEILNKQLRIHEEKIDDPLFYKAQAYYEAEAKKAGWVK